MHRKFYRMRDLASTPAREGRYPANPSTIWRWVQAGKFPQPVKLAGGTTAWPSDAIEQWESERGFKPRASILAAAQASQAKRSKGGQ